MPLLRIPERRSGLGRMLLSLFWIISITCKFNILLDIREESREYITVI